MYFSRITLDRRNPKEALEGAFRYGHKTYLPDAGVLDDHEWLWSFFPHDPDAKRDFVFRKLDASKDHGLGFYMVSARKPASPHPAWQVETRAYDPQIEVGQRLHFDLRANPVVTRDGVRHDVVMDEKTRLAREAGASSWRDLARGRRPEAIRPTYAFIHERVLAWLDGNAQSGFAARKGFRIARDDQDQPMLRVDAYQRHRLPRKAKNAGFTSVDLSGDLVVTDTTLFRSALLHGIGHEKVFGCGLLLVKPA